MLISGAPTVDYHCWLQPWARAEAKARDQTGQGGPRLPVALTWPPACGGQSIESGRLTQLVMARGCGSLPKIPSPTPEDVHARGVRERTCQPHREQTAYYGQDEGETNKQQKTWQRFGKGIMEPRDMVETMGFGVRRCDLCSCCLFMGQIITEHVLSCTRPGDKP